jgi:selenocysteine lyase/cysteine desulfurase
MTSPANGQDWQQIRARFPVLERKTYLNSCSYGALASEVEASLQKYLRARNENGAEWDYWLERNEAVRSSVARLLGVDAGEVAITASVSAGIDSLASALDFSGDRNKVVITDFEFPTNAQIWYAQEQRGAEVVRIAAEDGRIPLEKFAQAIDDRTLIVATAHVCFRNGARQDVAAISQIARNQGALMMVDGYQSLGTLRFDAKEAGADILVGGMLKYLLGTAGIGFMYVREELIPSLVPSLTGWFAQQNIWAMDISRYAPADSARRFEAGTPPVPNTYMAEAGLGILHEIGLEAIEARIQYLTDAIKTAAREARYHLATPPDRREHAAMITLDAADDTRLVSELANENIVVSCRDGRLRIAPHFYNDTADVEHLFRALHKHRGLLT